MATFSSRAHADRNPRLGISSGTPPFKQILGCFAVVLAWLMIAFVAFFVAGAGIRAYLISADAAVILFPILLRFLQGTFDLFEPLLVADLAWTAMMVVRPLADILTGHFHEHSYDISSSFDSALWLVLVTNLAFQLGYASPIWQYLLRTCPRLGNDFETRISLRYALSIAILGISLFTLYIRSEGGLAFLLHDIRGRGEVNLSLASIGPSSAYLYNGDSLLIPAGTIIFMIWLRKRNWRYLALSLAVILPYLAKATSKGDRSNLVGVLFGLPLMWYAYRHKRPSLPTLVIAGFVVGSAFSVIREVRLQTHGSFQTPTALVNKGPIAAVLSLFTSDDDEMFDVVAQEIEVVPNWVPYTHFGVIRDIAIRALPRVVFPNKPKEMGVQFFATMEPARARFGGAGTAQSLMGNFYLDSGAISAIFWMFVVGAALSTTWKWFLLNRGSPFALAIFSMVPAAVLNTLRGDLPYFFGTAFFTFLPLLLLPAVQHLVVRFKGNKAGPRSIAFGCVVLSCGSIHLLGTAHALARLASAGGISQ